MAAAAILSERNEAPLKKQRIQSPIQKSSWQIPRAVDPWPPVTKTKLSGILDAALLEEHYTFLCFQQRKEYERRQPLRDASKGNLHAFLSDRVFAGIRPRLVSWLVALVEHHRLYIDSVFLAVGYLDTYAVRRHADPASLTTSNYQLVGAAAMFLAAKLNDVLAPRVEDMLLYSDYAFERRAFLDMETDIFRTLDFHLPSLSSHAFIEIYVKAFALGRQTRNLAEYLSLLSLQHVVHAYKYSASEVARATLFLALFITTQSLPSARHKQVFALLIAEEPRQMVCVRSKSEHLQRMATCIGELHVFMIRASTDSQLLDLRTYYSHKKQDQVAKLEPSSLMSILEYIRECALLNQ